MFKYFNDVPLNVPFNVGFWRTSIELFNFPIWTMFGLSIDNLDQGGRFFLADWGQEVHKRSTFCHAQSSERFLPESHGSRETHHRRSDGRGLYLPKWRPHYQLARPNTVCQSGLYFNLSTPLVWSLPPTRNYANHRGNASVSGRFVACRPRSVRHRQQVRGLRRHPASVPRTTGGLYRGKCNGVAW